ncbi:STAS domain-containing protein [Asanoa sp. WMMD1127]|uniref:STAS domain-containing protein n=1 Tax=Asanoa sp. WMMD1127 TaxID=3016107 RepID=UPI002417D373|nr:STAS domain-containing protein [Asanoa sp. WMMD1127]MDG4824930.1 STAS domain-containing protein [Asanoa sp. WMMD1127]
MTAVPSTNGTTVDLICDDCGTVTTATSAYAHDEDLVWTVLIEVGWTGSPFAAGRHSCPRCAARTQRPPADDPGADERVGPPASFTVRHEAGVVVVAAQGDIEMQTADDLRTLLAAAIGTGRPVLLDLEGVNLIDSVGLGVLVRARQAARAQEVPLCLACPSRFMLAVLHTMRLRNAFPIFPSRASALSAMAWTTASDADVFVMRPQHLRPPIAMTGGKSGR